MSQVVVAAYGLDYQTKSSYSLLVQVNDTFNLSGNNTITVNLINVNEPPIINASSILPRYLPETAAARTLVPPPVSASNEDPGMTISYSLLTGAATFGIGSSNGSIWLLAANLNYLAQSVYNLTVLVQNSGGPQVQNPEGL